MKRCIYGAPVMLQQVLHKYTRVSSGSDGKEPVCSAEDLGLISGLGRSPGEGNGNPLQYSCLENPMDRGAWRATVWGCNESDMTEPLTLTLLYSNYYAMFFAAQVLSIIK